MMGLSAALVTFIPCRRAPRTSEASAEFGMRAVSSLILSFMTKHLIRQLKEGRKGSFGPQGEDAAHHGAGIRTAAALRRWPCYIHSQGVEMSECWCPAFSLVLNSGSQSSRWSCPHSRWVFSAALNIHGNALLGTCRSVLPY